MPLGARNIQQAVYTRLNAELSQDVYAYVPQDASFPYVFIGHDTASELTTKSTGGKDYTVTIHAFDRGMSGVVVKDILADIYDALHHQESAVTVTGFSLIDIVHEFSEVFYDGGNGPGADEEIHGVIRFRFRMQEE